MTIICPRCQRPRPAVVIVGRDRLEVRMPPACACELLSYEKCAAAASALAQLAIEAETEWRRITAAVEAEPA